MRHLLTVFSVLGCALGQAPVARADDAEDKAVALVEKLKGSVTRDVERTGKPVVAVSLPFAAQMKLTDADVKELATFKNLKTLALDYSQVTDDGLKALAPLVDLSVLLLGHTRVTNAGLKELAPLKGLATLDLRNVRVTDQGLKHLAPLGNLTSLDLRGTPVSDAGLKELTPLKELTQLYLGHTRGIGITDAGLKHLAGFKKLTSLTLHCEDVSDAGLKELGALESLTYLSLGLTKTTGAKVEELFLALPKCRLMQGPSGEPYGPSQRLRGSWEVSESGPTFAAKRLVFDGRKLTIVFGEKDKKEAEISIHPFGESSRMDITVDNVESLGIYEVSGDTLRICFSPKGDKRPTEYKAGEGIILVTLKREKK